MKTMQSSIRLSLALSALWLSACGGGGGDGPAPVLDPSAGVPPPVSAPAPAPVAGASWTATGAEDVWHSLSSSADGQVMVAGQAEVRTATSMLSISRDGGQTWTDQTAVGSGIWIASDVSGTGDRIAAVQFDGGLFLSSDRGGTFTQVPLPAGVTAPLQFESVTLSQDGTRIAAVVLNGPLLAGTIDAAGAVTWLTPAGLPATAGWRSVDSSANGQVLVAVGQDPVVFVSVNGGANWAPLAVTVDGAAVTTQNWYRVKLSADGNTIAMAGNAFGGTSGNGIYVSKNAGQTFTLAHSQVADYSSIAMSADGGVIAATHSTNSDPSGAGQVLLSTNGGTSFAPVAVNVGGAPVANNDWRAITMSANASRMALAAGRFEDNRRGAVYLSTAAP
jgi:hypothetical protein